MRTHPASGVLLLALIISQGCGPDRDTENPSPPSALPPLDSSEAAPSLGPYLETVPSAEIPGAEPPTLGTDGAASLFPRQPQESPFAGAENPNTAVTPEPSEEADSAGTAFDLGNEKNTTEFLNKFVDRWKENSLAPNPLVRQEGLASLRHELDEVNRQHQGKTVRWRFKGSLSASPPAVVVQAPSNFFSSTPGVSVALSTEDHIDDLRGMFLGGFTKRPVPPHLVAGRDISEEDFRELQGGEEWLVEGTIQELRYPSLEMMNISLMIDVYICRARIVGGPYY